MTNRKPADTNVPISPPISLNCAKRPCTANAVAAISAVASTMTVECPSEKKMPAASGRLPCCISLRVTLSMAAVIRIDRVAQPERVRE